MYINLKINEKNNIKEKNIFIFKEKKNNSLAAILET